PPPPWIFGQQRRIVAVTRDQNFPPALGRQCDLGKSVRSGLSRRAGDGLAPRRFFQQFEPGAGDRFSVFERRRPSQQLRLIGESIKPYLGGLNPGRNELWAVRRRGLRRGLDDQQRVPNAIAQRGNQINRRNRDLIPLRVDLDRIGEDSAAYFRKRRRR